ncbi:hypothetical protein BDZ88DRAFT_147219 [Geranomyces variabilis]|nr:hypothetical protein BDZ88DRAFT_147219 [Geranomyces variabilis]
MTTSSKLRKRRFTHWSLFLLLRAALWRSGFTSMRSQVLSLLLAAESALCVRHELVRHVRTCERACPAAARVPINRGFDRLLRICYGARTRLARRIRNDACWDRDVFGEVMSLLLAAESAFVCET